MPTPAERPAPEPTVPVVEERLTIGRRHEEIGALRVRLELERHDAEVPLERVAETVEVERIAIGRIVDTRRDPWQDGETIVVPVYAEVAVVQRQLMLVEELRLVRRRARSVETVTVPLARQRAVVERRGADGHWVESPADDPDAGDAAPARKTSDDVSQPPGDP